MSVRASLKTILAAPTTWFAIVNAGDPDPVIDPATRVYCNESPEGVDAPFMVYSYNQSTQTASAGDGTIGLTNGSFQAIIQLPIPSGYSTIDEESEAIEVQLEAYRDELSALSASGTYILLRDFAWGVPQKSDNEFTDSNGNRFWECTLSGEFGLTL